MIVSTPDNLRLRLGLSEGSKPRVMKSRPESVKADRHGFFVVSILQKFLRNTFLPDKMRVRLRRQPSSVFTQ